MRKFTVVSGFLGSGKTTTMMALTDHLCRTGRSAAMISNDLGGKGLADYRYSKAAGIRSEEICGDCICYVTEQLVERLRRLYSEDGCELVMSDIPGFGVGALSHVYYKLRDMYPGECDLAPFTVITEGASLRRLEEDDMGVLVRAQLLEGDLIVLNKCDLYTDRERAGYLSVIRDICPDTPIIEISAATGEGIPELADYLYSAATGFPEPEFGVTDGEFEAAFDKLSMYNCQYYAEVCCDDFDANEYLTGLACEIRDGLREIGGEIPHLKLFAQREDGAFSRVDLLGVERGVIVTHAMTGRCTDVSVVLNATSEADVSTLTEIIDGAVWRVSARFNLSVVVYYKEGVRP